MTRDFQDVDSSFASLPLFAQALIAARFARRAILAMISGDEQEACLAACTAVDGCARIADGWKSDLPTFRVVERIRQTRDNAASLECLRLAIDACGAAQGALDFPVDATVTASALRAIASLAQDRRVSPLQIQILLASDVDQVRFACDEIRLGKYDGLTDHVFGRLTPVHALTLAESENSPSSEVC